MVITMGELSKIRSNIDNNIIRLKKEWKVIREIWKDSKSKEYESEYLVPIIIKQKNISTEIETLEKISLKLRSLGVDV